MQPPAADVTNPTPKVWVSASPLMWLALLVAILSAAGSLALSLAEGKKACALCFYQRALILSLVAVLTSGLLTRALRVPSLAVLSLPLALGGLGVAAFHVSLEVRGILECPPGLFGIASAPKQSLAAFGVLSAILAAEVLRGLKLYAVGLPGVLVALVLAGGIVWASVSANPPPPPAPSKKYDNPVPDICRPPYHESAQAPGFPLAGAGEGA
jgi:disulfide bond formation protein DsbB